MDCTDGGATPAATQTQPLRGPAGLSAVLKVTSADDHSKESHQCEAQYQLLITAGDAAPVAVDLLTSDDDYGRHLDLALEGFSQDGNLILGILSEGNPHPSTTLFVYNTTDHQTQLIDLRKRLAPGAANCDATFDVIGTTKTDGIVIEVDSASRCVPHGRWLITKGAKSLAPVPQGAPVQKLYQPTA